MAVAHAACSNSHHCSMGHTPAQAFFCNTGTEANEAAIKFARKWARVRVCVVSSSTEATSPRRRVGWHSCKAIHQDHKPNRSFQAR
jgi:4-aminobutyrate aminotransferase-like enzyme